MKSEERNQKVYYREGKTDESSRTLMIKERRAKERKKERKEEKNIEKRKEKFNKMDGSLLARKTNRSDKNRFE